MADTTITIRTDESTKHQASAVFESLGMTLSSAINMFLRQTVIKKTFPCSLDSGLVEDCRSTYSDDFFNLFGSGKDDPAFDISQLQFTDDIKREIM